MNDMTAIGDRIREHMPAGMSQRQLAERAGMTPDALSRALNGQRGLSSIEVARIAEVLGADTHWLITGTPDPFRVDIAARHAWDAQTRTRTNAGRGEDQAALDKVVDVYRAAFPRGAAASKQLPRSPTIMRERLGEDFVFTFVENVERSLEVDVIRIPGLSTDYSLRLGDRGIIVLASMSSWFRSNWSLAHELGHLALGHHDRRTAQRPRSDSDERAANAYASQLLIPAVAMDRVAAAADEHEVASIVWQLGVSTESLRNRVDTSRIAFDASIAQAINKSTLRLMRDNPTAVPRGDAYGDPVAARERASSARYFPLSLLAALREQTMIGAASPVHLAWALDVPIDDLDFPEPDDDADALRYAAMVSEAVGQSAGTTLSPGPDT